MRRMSYQQFAIVQGDSAQHLTDLLNRKLYELRDKQPTVTFEGLIARISYKEETTAFEPDDGQSGPVLNLKCKDCPMFEPVRTKDGRPDRRTSFGFCRYALEGQTVAGMRACNRLFEMINEREVKLCFKEE